MTAAEPDKSPKTVEPIDYKKPEYYLNRQLSLLEFPIFKFLSKMEFFMFQVVQVQRLRKMPFGTR